MFDWDSFEQAGIAAATEAMTRAADLIASRAKAKAPVRNVFGGAVTYKVKSISEIERDRGIRRTLGLSPESTHVMPPLKAIKRPPQALHLRTAPIDLSSLSRRGRYELRSGRAGQELGGRLQREIYAEEAKIEGRKITARVVSPTPYAKYVEFGTRHNAAYPYLRPAAHESQGEIVADIAASVAQAARGAAKGRRTTVKVPMKVVVR